MTASKSPEAATCRVPQIVSVEPDYRLCGHLRAEVPQRQRRLLGHARLQDVRRQIGTPVRAQLVHEDLHVSACGNCSCEEDFPGKNHDSYSDGKQFVPISSSKESQQTYADASTPCLKQRKHAETLSSGVGWSRDQEIAAIRLGCPENLSFPKMLSWLQARSDKVTDTSCLSGCCSCPCSSAPRPCPSCCRSRPCSSAPRPCP